MKTIVALGTFLCLATPVVAQEQITYAGSCDGSAAAMLGPGRFVTVSDEENSVRTYAIVGGSDHLDKRIDLSSLFGPELKVQEGDFEAAARAGDIIYWIGSFGSGKKGGAQPARRRFFATRIAADGTLELLGTPQSRTGSALFDALISHPALASYKLADAALLPPKSAGALNIEGLAVDGVGNLRVGFRNPQTASAGYALVVTLANPLDVITKSAPAQIIDVDLIDLEHRGIRDMVYRAAQKDFILIAGTIDEMADFALFRWTGLKSEKPVKLTTNFGQLNPEGVTVLDDRRLLILSDDGEVAPQAGGPVCKDLPADKRQFRGLIMAMPK